MKRTMLQLLLNNEPRDRVTTATVVIVTMWLINNNLQHSVEVKYLNEREGNGI